MREVAQNYGVQRYISAFKLFLLRWFEQLLDCMMML